MKEVLFLTTDDARPGFALTGVRQQALTPSEIWEALREACKDPRFGVIAVDARLLESIDPERLQELAQGWQGVLVTLPAPAGMLEEPHDEIQALVRRALGYHVKLEG